MSLEQLSSIKNVAKFLGSREDTVIILLEEGRLGGVLITALSRRGVSVTPGVKNSVETVVRAIKADEDDAAASVDKLNQIAGEATATIMFTDLVASSAIMDRLGDRLARGVFRKHDEVIRRHTKAYGGTEVKSMGDGFMLSFRSARRGVACAVAVQRELAEYNSEQLEPPLAVRMGLSVGEPIREEEDLFGKSVVLASRISSVAEGGQVLTCSITQALVAGTGEFTLREVGAFELKGIPGAHILFEVLWRQP